MGTPEWCLIGYLALLWGVGIWMAHRKPKPRG